MEKLFVSVKEACTRTGLSRKYIYEGCHSGTIPCIRIGNRGDYRIHLPAFLALLEKESRGE